MFSRILKRFWRAPMAALSVIVLAAVLSGALCALNAANVAEQARYEQTLRDVKVELVVTNLSGTRRTGLDAPIWVTNVFTSSVVDNSLRDYVEDLIYSCTYPCEYATMNGEEYQNLTFVGPSSLSRSDGSFGDVTYFADWDDSDMEGKQLYCIIPERMLPKDYEGSEPLEVTVACSTVVPPGVKIYTYNTLRVIGWHTGTGSIVAPYEVVRGVYSSFGFYTAHDAVSAVLIDSSTMEEVRELSKTWFAEPNPTGEKTPWDYSYYFWYPYALKIDDSLLVNAETTLKISLLINELCAVLVFALSAGASFFVGFLMIRSRKREIALMRTLGTPVPSVFLSFALEQLLCLLAGTAIGGGIFGFEPPERLVAFAAVYFTGLCLALVIFLGKNLMTTLKEDE